MPFTSLSFSHDEVTLERDRNCIVLDDRTVEVAFDGIKVGSILRSHHLPRSPLAAAMGLAHRFGKRLCRIRIILQPSLIPSKVPE